jgi:hypothetical protein
MHNAAAHTSNSASTSSSIGTSSDSGSSDTSNDAATAAAASWAVRHRTDVLTQRAAKFNSWQARHMCSNFKYMNIYSILFSSLAYTPHR